MSMCYQQALDFLYSQLPMFQRVGGTAFKKDLSRTLALCQHLDNPQHKFRSIHVGGTNGKGSVSHMLAAILQAQGLKVGLYTSPHLLDFRERIKINGQMMPEHEVVQFVEEQRPVLEQVQPSFFEMTVALAFDYFARQKVDIAVVEVGMGGRFDSTNVLHPELSIITNISLEHTQFLGNTRAEIAFEKAGIIKHQVPVVVGEKDDETAPVFQQKAAEEEAPLSFAPDLFQAEIISQEVDYLLLNVNQAGKDEPQQVKLPLPGSYQQENIQTVLAAVSALRKDGWELPEVAVQAGLEQVKVHTGFRGRWDVVQQQPLVVLDVAHNVAGIRQVLAQLEHVQYRHLHFVTGMVADKDVEGVLRLFPKEATYYFCRPDLPRGLDEKVLHEKAQQQELSGRHYPSVAAALEAAKAAAATEDLVLVTGSAFVVAEALAVQV